MSLTLSETPKTGFVATRPNIQYLFKWTHKNGKVRQMATLANSDRTIA